jgi:UDP-N-acetyl-D-mannosaminuronate dehydrogenase
MAKKKPLIGFVGQGYVGESYANNFERRGFKIVRYSLDEQYCANQDHIQHCDVMFVCVPTPTTPKGFDVSMVNPPMTRKPTQWAGSNTFCDQQSQAKTYRRRDSKIDDCLY